MWRNLHFNMIQKIMWNFRWCWWQCCMDCIYVNHADFDEDRPTQTHTKKNRNHWHYLWQLIRFLCVCVAFHSTKRQTNRLFLHIIEAHCPPLNDYSINNNEDCITWLICIHHVQWIQKKKSALVKVRVRARANTFVCARTHIYNALKRPHSIQPEEK